MTEPTPGSPPAAERGAVTERRIRGWVLTALAILGPPALLLLYYRAMFVGLVNVDALDFAQVARNVATGHGFTTQVIRPLALGAGGQALQQPDVVHGPLFPLCLAMAFAAAGARDTVAAGVSGFFYLLTIPVVYLLGRRVFGRGVGALAAVIFAVNALVLEYAISGLHVTLCILLVTTAFTVLYGIAARGADGERAGAVPRGAVALAGALAALLYLTEPMLVWLAPVMGAAIWAFVPARRASALGLFAAAFVVLAGPWMVRNARLTGDPVFALRGLELWMYTRNSFPGISAYRMMPQEMNPSPELLKDVVRKVFVGAGTVLNTWPQIAANWALAFFLPSLLFRFNNRAASQLRRYLVAGFLVVMLGMLLFQIQMPLFVAFVPAMLVFAVAYLLFLVQQAQLTRGGRVWLAALLATALVYPVAVQLVEQEKPPTPAGKQTALALSRAGKPEDVVLTNQPWVMAWYGNRPAVLIPLTDARITDVRQRFPGLRWLVLTQDVTAWSPSWEMTFGALERWSAAWLLAVRTKEARRPGQIMFRGPEPPLMGALAGFVSVPPVEPLVRGNRNTVVALLPPQGTGGGTRR